MLFEFDQPFPQSIGDLLEVENYRMKAMKKRIFVK